MSLVPLQSHSYGIDHLAKGTGLTCGRGKRWSQLSMTQLHYLSDNHCFSISILSVQSFVKALNLEGKAPLVSYTSQYKISF